MVSMTTIHSRKQRCAFSERPGHFQRYFLPRQGQAHIQRSVVHRYASPKNVLDSLMQRLLIPGHLMLCPNIRVRVQNGTACMLGTGAAIETHWRQLENADCVKKLKDSESPTYFVCFISRVIRLLMGSRSIKVAGMATATSLTPPARSTAVIMASAYAGKWYVVSVKICN
jgi:hypothetical protein